MFHYKNNESREIKREGHLEKFNLTDLKAKSYSKHKIIFFRVIRFKMQHYSLGFEFMQHCLNIQSITIAIQ